MLYEVITDKILLAFSVMLSLPGTPVIYYGDEFGKPNDEDYYKYQINITGHNDTRNYVRGKIDWEKLEKQLNNAESSESKIYTELKKMIAVRKRNNILSTGRITSYNVCYTKLLRIREFCKIYLTCTQYIVSLSDSNHLFKLRINL